MWRVVTTLVAGFALVPGLTAIPAAAGSGGPVSDDFFAGLDTARWQVVDPKGDGSVSVTGEGTGDARLSIAVPAGSTHDAWGKNESVRVLQEVADGDFEVEARFESVPTGTHADQGLQVHGTDAWLRFGVYSKNTQLHAFAAATDGNTSTKKLQQQVTSTPDGMWLRVARTDTTFTFRYSADGLDWTTIGSFGHGLTVARLGPYAGNAGSNPPAHTALVDYLFDTAAPLDPEDGGLGDTTAPTITNVQATPASQSAQLTWTTDEPTTGHVEYGPDQTYGDTLASATTGTSHEVTLTSLTPETTYHYRITVTDTADNTTVTDNATFNTSIAGPPTIELWHESTLTIGAQGLSQPWANVLGNVHDPSGIASLDYTLNGGSPRALTVGPDDRRLQAPGDFNADIWTADLQPGDNTVVVTAHDNDGDTAQVTTTVRRVSTSAPPLPHVQEWSPEQGVQDQATVVDGKWRVTADGTLAVERPGYDRLVSLGDLAWRDYEVTVPVTVHGLGAGAYTTSGAPLLGLALRWQGHTAANNAQPAWKYFPVGAYAWCKLYKRGAALEILGNENDPYVSVPSGFELETTYRMKARVETLGDGTTRFAFRMWAEGSPEPQEWAVDVTDTGPATGSVGLIAHHLDMEFGTVEVTPLG